MDSEISTHSQQLLGHPFHWGCVTLLITSTCLHVLLCLELSYIGVPRLQWTIYSEIKLKNILLKHNTKSRKIEFLKNISLFLYEQVSDRFFFFFFFFFFFLKIF